MINPPLLLRTGDKKMIEFKHVNKSYGDQTIIHDLSLSIESGKITVVIGLSGSGKSTLLKMINRLEPFNSGSIFFRNQDILTYKPEDLRRRMGYAIQSNGLFPHWNVAKNIATVPRLLGWDKEIIDRRVDELLIMLNLDPVYYRKRMPHQLSGGQQQRVGVARAMAAKPEILLMDEPFGALDPITRKNMQTELRRIHQHDGKTILLITHDIDEALYLADHIVLIDKGTILQQGSPLKVLTEPTNAFVREFFGQKSRGLKILSRLPIQAILRPENSAATSVTIEHTATLADALSSFIAERTSVLAVSNQYGENIGHIKLNDIFSCNNHSIDPHAYDS